jgi:hypothetical protein
VTDAEKLDLGARILRRSQVEWQVLRWNPQPL